MGITLVSSKLGDTTLIISRFPSTKLGFPFSPDTIFVNVRLKFPLVGKTKNKLNKGVYTGKDSNPDKVEEEDNKHFEYFRIYLIPDHNRCKLAGQ